MINRRRAPSSAISSQKKRAGHILEEDFASFIGASVIKGTQKADIKDKLNNLYSVKSGKKWQLFLYNYERISSSAHLKILQDCLDAFPRNIKKYFEDRISCIKYKEDYIKKNGREEAKSLSNNDVKNGLGFNEYISSKTKLQQKTREVRDKLKDKATLRLFLNEAIFNNDEVSLMAIMDTTFLKDDLFKVFSKEYILDVLCKEVYPDVSSSGNVPEDYNVGGQKTLLRYYKDGKPKNIAEIEIRNDSETKYRLVRFNMYSKDVLGLLLRPNNMIDVYKINSKVEVYGRAIEIMELKKKGSKFC